MVDGDVGVVFCGISCDWIAVWVDVLDVGWEIVVCECDDVGWLRE